MQCCRRCDYNNARAPGLNNTCMAWFIYMQCEFISSHSRMICPSSLHKLQLHRYYNTYNVYIIWRKWCSIVLFVAKRTISLHLSAGRSRIQPNPTLKKHVKNFHFVVRDGSHRYSFRMIVLRWPVSIRLNEIWANVFGAFTKINGGL